MDVKLLAMSLLSFTIGSSWSIRHAPKLWGLVQLAEKKGNFSAWQNGKNAYVQRYKICRFRYYNQWINTGLTSHYLKNKIITLFRLKILGNNFHIM